MSDPQYEAPIVLPGNVEHGAGDQLWVPESSRWKVEYHDGWAVGKAPESGQLVWKLEFILRYGDYWKPFSILWEEGDSEDQIEDLLGWTAERTANAIADQLDRQGSKLRPEDLALRQNWGVRRQLAGAWRDYRKWRTKAKESTVGKEFFKGIR